MKMLFSSVRGLIIAVVIIASVVFISGYLFLYYATTLPVIGLVISSLVYTVVIFPAFIFLLTLCLMLISFPFLYLFSIIVSAKNKKIINNEIDELKIDGFISKSHNLDGYLKNFFSIDDTTAILSRTTQESTEVMYLFERVTILRIIPNNLVKFPSCVINSYINNQTEGSVDVSSLMHKPIDLGSDFGQYISIYTTDKGNANITNLFSPDVMVDYLSKGIYFDTVVSSTAIDFVYSNGIIPTREAIKNAEEISNIFYDKLSKSYKPITISASLRNLKDPFKKLQNKIMALLLICLGLLFASSFLTALPRFAITDIIIGIIVVILMAVLTILIAVLAYVFLIQIVVNVLFNTKSKYKGWVAVRRYNFIKEKYSY